MNDFKVDTEAFEKSMHEAADKFGRNVTDALRRGARTAATYAKVNTLFKSQTGALRSSIEDKVVTSTEAEVSAKAKHAVFVEEGTRPHIIPAEPVAGDRARRKKMLRFEQNGVIRFEFSVRHPGTKPRPFMQRARDKAEPLFERFCVEAVDRTFE